MHPISEDELESIAQSGNALNLTFFGIAGGAFITLLATIITVTFGNPWTHASFVMLTWLSGLSTAFFTVRVIQDKRELNAKLNKFRKATPLSTAPSAAILMSPITPPE
jgi:hypothetical protein